MKSHSRFPAKVFGNAMLASEVVLKLFAKASYEESESKKIQAILFSHMRLFTCVFLSTPLCFFFFTSQQSLTALRADRF